LILHHVQASKQVVRVWVGVCGFVMPCLDFPFLPPGCDPKTATILELQLR
jgi:hypothetical protein